jgi:rare lipoprotein A (peptidoglycan hydrolase)
MRRIVIALLALIAFGGYAEARSRHHYHHHHRGHGYSHHHHHMHFRGRHHHSHHRYGHRAQRQALAAEALAAQSWFGTPAPEYPQARSKALTSQTSRAWTHAPSFGASSAAGRVVRASWYGGGEKLSSRTASGEHFNRGGLTAAHRSLPFGTRVQVTNVATGRAVVVRINDRGPFVGGRSLDLARGAAQAIGLHSTGAVRMVVLN